MSLLFSVACLLSVSLRSMLILIICSAVSCMFCCLQMIYFVDFDMEAENLDNPFMIGMPDPYVEVYRVRQYIWELIATTETHERSCNPHFGRIVVSVDQLCNMQ